MELFDFLKNKDKDTQNSTNQTTSLSLDAMRNAANAATPTINKDTIKNALDNVSEGIKLPTVAGNVTTTYTTGANNKPYMEQLDSLYNQIMNRGPFQYDLNGDMLYRQMADQYMQLGQQAMRDTMGQASALTGGYGNSYAASAGNQEYQQYITQLNNNIPALYDRALQAWQMQGDDLLNQYQLAAAHPGYREALAPKSYTVTQPGNVSYAAMLAEALREQQAAPYNALANMYDTLYKLK